MDNLSITTTMIKQLRSLLPFLSKDPSLHELDVIYKKAISQLPINEQKEYCERLLNRTAFELKRAKCKYEIQQLKELSRAAKAEISNLGA